MAVNDPPENGRFVLYCKSKNAQASGWPWGPLPYHLRIRWFEFRFLQLKRVLRTACDFAHTVYRPHDGLFINVLLSLEGHPSSLLSLLSCCVFAGLSVSFTNAVSGFSVRVQV